MLREFPRFGGAARRERLGEEIKHHRPALQLVRQSQGEGLARHCAAGGEVGRLGPDGQRRHGALRTDGGSGKGESDVQASHHRLPLFSGGGAGDMRSEEHTSELQSLMRISYAVFCLKKKNKKKNTTE